MNKEFNVKDFLEINNTIDHMINQFPKKTYVDKKCQTRYA